MTIAVAPYSTTGIKKAIAPALAMMAGDGAMACLWRAAVWMQRDMIWIQRVMVWMSATMA